MARNNWGAENPVDSATRNADRAARQAKAKQMDQAAATAGRGKRRI